MYTRSITSSAVVLFMTGSWLGTVLVAAAQTPLPAGAMRQPTASSSSPDKMAAERAQIWDSSDMLRARAWLKDYCSKSVKVTPEMAKQYETELANMTPNQMRLWLMKFDEEEQQRQQQYAMFQQGNAAGLKQAIAAHRQTQQGYAAMNQAQNAAAQNAQQQITEQRESAQNAQEDRSLYQTGPSYAYPYSFGPFGYGGIHYHYHLY
jgi:hypothetical protein